MDTSSTGSLPSANPGSGPYTCWRPGQTLESDRDAGEHLGDSAGAPPSNTHLLEHAENIVEIVQSD